jgi:hypothetical protein
LAAPGGGGGGGADEPNRAEPGRGDGDCGGDNGGDVAVTEW